MVGKVERDFALVSGMETREREVGFLEGKIEIDSDILCSVPAFDEIDPLDWRNLW